MSSPKIREALIPRIDRAAREGGVPLTRWVNEAVETALADPRRIGGEDLIPIGNKDTTGLDQPTTEGGHRP